MATVKKRTAKGSAKRAAAKAKTNGTKTAKNLTVKKAFTKSELLNTLAENTGLAKKEISSVLENLVTVVEKHVTNKNVGTFTLPGLLKIKTKRQPARKARKGINPFTKEETVFKARPARTVVKIQPLRGLKAMVE